MDPQTYSRRRERDHHFERENPWNTRIRRNRQCRGQGRQRIWNARLCVFEEEVCGKRRQVLWRYRENRESLKTDYPFLSLPNFIGTPHVSGPSGLATGRPVQLAMANTIRYLKGLRPRNIVNSEEYKTSYPY